MTALAPITITVTPSNAMMAAVLTLVSSGSLVIEATGITDATIALRATVAAPVAAPVPVAAANAVVPPVHEATVVQVLPDLLAGVETVQGPATDAEGVIARLAANPMLKDVCQHLVLPLVRRFNTEQPSESVLVRMANEFCLYAPSQLRRVTSILLQGKHVHIPDHAEIYEALGRAMRPMARQAEAA